MNAWRVIPLETLYVVRGAGHDFRGGSHQRARRERQLDTAGVDRGLAVRRFVGTHLFDDRSRLTVSFMQLVQMAVEMMLHLKLRLRHDVQTDAIADAAGSKSDCH